MITKADFLAGIPFHFLKESKHRPYVFEIDNRADRKPNDPVGYMLFFGSDEGNVSRVTEKYFDIYTTLCHKVVRARIHFTDLYL